MPQTKIPENKLSVFERQALVLENQDLVWYYVNRICKIPELMEDCFQEGCCGLSRAAKYFDPERQNKFSTFAAFEIQCSIRDFLFKSSSELRLPDNERKLITAYRDAVRQLEVAGKRLTVADKANLASQLGMSDACFRTLISDSISLDAPVSGEDSSVLGDLIEDPTAQGFEESCSFQELVNLFKSKLESIYETKANLTESDRKILRAYADKFIGDALGENTKTYQQIVLECYPEWTPNASDNVTEAKAKAKALDNMYCRLSQYRKDAEAAIRKYFVECRACGML